MFFKKGNKILELFMPDILINECLFQKYSILFILISKAFQHKSFDLIHIVLRHIPFLLCFYRIDWFIVLRIFNHWQWILRKESFSSIRHRKLWSHRLESNMEGLCDILWCCWLHLNVRCLWGVVDSWWKFWTHIYSFHINFSYGNFIVNTCLIQTPISSGLLCSLSTQRLSPEIKAWMLYHLEYRYSIFLFLRFFDILFIFRQNRSEK